MSDTMPPMAPEAPDTQRDAAPDAPSAAAPAAAAVPPRSRLSTAIWIICVVLLIALFAGLLLRVRGQEGRTRVADALTLGKRPAAPALPIAKLPDAGTPGLPSWYHAVESRQVGNSSKGRILLVNFWASWCGPCDAEADDLQHIAETYRKRGVIVVGLNIQDAATDARGFIKRHKITFPIVRGGPDDKVAWGVSGFPESFIVGVDGKISVHIPGQIDPDTLKALLDDEIDARKPVA